MNVTPLPDSVWIENQAGGPSFALLAAARRHWRLFAVLFAACVATATVLAFVLPSYWRVEITVMPVTTSNNVNIGSALGGLAGLSGLGALLGRPATNQDEAMAVLRSRELFDTYATQKNLLPILYASKWEASTEQWTVSSSRIPTLRQAFKLFDGQVRDIDLDRRSGILTLSITWKDRVLAAQWARDLIDLTNSQLRQRALEDAQRNMNYLSAEMRKTGADGAQNALTAALASSYDRELQNYMFAKGQPEFAFRVIDPPTIPDERERVFPKRTLFVALGAILGLVLGFGAVWLADARQRRAALRSRAIL
jgi:uncharacterized protein involved in exopolysaccharide biosynthesis